MCNMKIKVENNLDEIAGELERLGYKPWCVAYIGVSIVATNKRGNYTTFHKDIWDSGILTTLSELKDMQNAK